MIPDLSPLKLPARWTLQKLRPPSRKKLFLLEDFSVEGEVNLGCVYRFETGEPCVAPGAGKVISIKLIFPTWKYTSGSQLGFQPTYEITIDHGNDVWTTVHGLLTCAVQTAQPVERGDIIGYLLTDELFFQIKWYGKAYDPASVSRHFQLQDGTHAVGRTGYIKEAADRLPRSFTTIIRQVIVGGIHYFVNILGYQKPVLVNIDFNGSDGTVTEGRGALGYSNFTNWDVVDNGSVDLIGRGFYDFLPGNGLYIDMSGSGNAGGSMSWYGRLESKTTFTFTLGQTFRLSWRAAGNQRLARAHEILNYKAGALVDSTIDITDYMQPFQDYYVDFVGDGSTGKISFRKIALETDPGQAYGSLLDSISLENLTTATTLLTDDFDLENGITTARYWGPAVVGTTGDYWNNYVPVAFTKDYRNCFCGYDYSFAPEVCFTYSATPYIYLKDAVQTDTPIWLERIAPLVNNSGVTPTWNGMLQTWIGGYDMGGVPYDSIFRLHGLPPGTYQLYLYSDQKFGTAGSDYYVQVDGGTILHATTAPTGVTSWTQNDNFVLFTGLDVVPGSVIRIEIVGYVAGLQVVRV
jgi:hypothetical protein